MDYDSGVGSDSPDSIKPRKKTMNTVSQRIFRTLIVVLMSPLLFGQLPSLYRGINAYAGEQGQKDKDEIKGAMAKATTARNEVYGVYVPARQRDPYGKRLGRVEGQRQAKWDRTITEDERFKL